MNSLDKTLTLWLNFDGGAVMDRIMWIASGKLTWLPLYLLLIYVLWRRFGWKYMLIVLAAAVVGVVVSDQICNYFKHTFQMMRPTHDGTISDLVHTVVSPRNRLPYVGGLYGTVSAHAATVTTIAAVIGHAIKNRWYKIIIPVWVLTVCYSRIYLGVHFLSQIIFGVVLGLLTAYLLNRLLVRYFDRYKLPTEA